MAEKKSYFDEPNDVTIEDETITSEAQFDETTTSRTGAAVLRITLAALLFVAFALISWFSVIGIAGDTGANCGASAVQLHPCGAGVGAGCGAALRQIQPRGGSWPHFHASYRGFCYCYGGHAHAFHRFQGRACADGRPCAGGCGCRAVLDGMGCGKGLFRGRRTYVRHGVLGGADDAARCDGRR